MQKHPLAEIFGYPANNFTPEADRHRVKRLCPFNNKVPNCTKDKAKDPLGVCSIFDDGKIIVTCPVRFRQNWIIADDAAAFFFPENAKWTSLAEVRLDDKDGRSAGNIDVVLVAYDDAGKITDFGSVEVQAVYISGNVRRPFEKYIENPKKFHDMKWDGPNYPRADFLSSSRKRLAPQLIYKGGIMNFWNRKMAVAVDRRFFASLPDLPETTKDKADIAWMVYDLALNKKSKQLDLIKYKIVYTSFEPALEIITRTEAGPIEKFITKLQEKLDEKLENGNSPDAPSLADIIEQE